MPSVNESLLVGRHPCGEEFNLKNFESSALSPGTAARSLFRKSGRRLILKQGEIQRSMQVPFHAFLARQFASLLFVLPDEIARIHGLHVTTRTPCLSAEPSFHNVGPREWRQACFKSMQVFAALLVSSTASRYGVCSRLHELIAVVSTANLS